MMPAGAERRQAQKVCALATGICDKAVSLVYESCGPQPRHARLG